MHWSSQKCLEVLIIGTNVMYNFNMRPLYTDVLLILMLLMLRNCFIKVFFFSQSYAVESCILKSWFIQNCSPRDVLWSLFPFWIVFWVQLYHVISRTSLMLAVFDINLVHRLPATCLPLPHGQRRRKKKRHSPVFYLVYCLIAPSTAKDASALGWVNFHRMNLIGLGNPTFFCWSMIQFRSSIFWNSLFWQN